MAKTFRSAIREYRPVMVPLLVADMIAAFWLLRDSSALFRVRVAAFTVATVALWLMTLAVCAVFAAKDVWLSRKTQKRARITGPSRHV